MKIFNTSFFSGLMVGLCITSAISYFVIKEQRLEAEYIGVIYGDVNQLSKWVGKSKIYLKNRDHLSLLQVIDCSLPRSVKTIEEDIRNIEVRNFVSASYRASRVAGIESRLNYVKDYLAKSPYASAASDCEVGFLEAGSRAMDEFEKTRNTQTIGEGLRSMKQDSE